MEVSKMSSISKKMVLILAVVFSFSIGINTVTFAAESWSDIENVQINVDEDILEEEEGTGADVVLPEITDEIIEFQATERVGIDQADDLSKVEPLITDQAVFTPRLEAPDSSIPYYNATLNPFFPNNPMPNCTAYAWGRAYEITGTRPTLNTGNAQFWYDNNGSYPNANDRYARGQTPKLGAIACWNYSDGGHVAVVEKIEGNTITLSQSAWRGRYFYTQTTSNVPGLHSNFAGYIYIGEFESPPPQINEKDFVLVTDGEKQGEVYRIAGGAPIIVNSWSVFGGVQPYKNITQDQLNSLSSTPKHHTFLLGMPSGEWAYRAVDVKGVSYVYRCKWSDFGTVPIHIPIDDWIVKNADSNAAAVNGKRVLNFSPFGSLEVVSGNDGTITVKGWAADGSDPSRPVYIDVYIGGGAGAPGAEGHRINANITRSDVNTEYPGLGNNHGFNETITTNKRGAQQVVVYALNLAGTPGENKELGHQTVTIAEPSTTTIPATSIKLNKNITEISLNTSETLVASVFPENATNKSVAWSTSNPNIVTVNNGVVKGISQGTATIVVSTHNGLTASCKVTVIPTVTPHLATPQNCKAQSVGYDSIKVTWSSVLNAEGYYIYRSTSKSGGYTKIKTITGGNATSYIDKKLVAGKIYYYKIVAYSKASGATVKSASSLVVYAKPTVPRVTTLKAKGYAGGKVRLTWKESIGASGYYVYQATSKIGTYKNIKKIPNGSAKSFTKSELESGKTYYYKIVPYRMISGAIVKGVPSVIVSGKAR